MQVAHYVKTFVEPSLLINIYAAAILQNKFVHTVDFVLLTFLTILSRKSSAQISLLKKIKYAIFLKKKNYKRKDINEQGKRQIG